MHLKNIFDSNEMIGSCFAILSGISLGGCQSDILEIKVI
jgi:hypothetical protein